MGLEDVAIGAAGAEDEPPPPPLPVPLDPAGFSIPLEKEDY
jgi:hypothetical protein